MRLPVLVPLALGLAAPALAQSSSAVPTGISGVSPCIFICLSTTPGCSYADLQCSCTNTVYQNAVEQCLETECSSQDQDAARQLQQSNCAAFSSSASATESAASSALSSLSSAASSALSSLSSAESSAASSVLSSLSSAASSALNTSPNAAQKAWTDVGAGAVEAEIKKLEKEERELKKKKGAWTAAPRGKTKHDQIPVGYEGSTRDYGVLLSRELREASRKLKDLRRKAKITPDKTASAASASGIPDDAMDVDEPEQPINISISSPLTPITKTPPPRPSVPTETHDAERGHSAPEDSGHSEHGQQATEEPGPEGGESNQTQSKQPDFKLFAEGLSAVQSLRFHEAMTKDVRSRDSKRAAFKIHMEAIEKASSLGFPLTAFNWPIPYTAGEAKSKITGDDCKALRNWFRLWYAEAEAADSAFSESDYGPEDDRDGSGESEVEEEANATKSKAKGKGKGKSQSSAKGKGKDKGADSALLELWMVKTAQTYNVPNASNNEEIKSSQTRVADKGGKVTVLPYKLGFSLLNLPYCAAAIAETSGLHIDHLLQPREARLKETVRWALEELANAHAIGGQESTELIIKLMKMLKAPGAEGADEMHMEAAEGAEGADEMHMEGAAGSSGTQC
ncbi:hypothetical protein FA95DRAFT_1612465 [Auriscalpium vulgare]|uniref:Uncharacterized protein n=1 Tax=Auriscalpium vulgare TaxID=40419 RepID=A0ACB8R646_9AGAM|nr:hypothetical protein FA95DRAFT_1612465 [Auriscalpium vulgare]